MNGLISNKERHIVMLSQLVSFGAHYAEMVAKALLICAQVIKHLSAQGNNVRTEMGVICGF